MPVNIAKSAQEKNDAQRVIIESLKPKNNPENADNFKSPAPILLLIKKGIPMKIKGRKNPPKTENIYALLKFH